MRSAQSVVVRNAMPPLGDTDGAGGSDAVGEAPHSVAVLTVISEPVERDQLHSNLSTTLRPLVERERRERGDEDGAVGVAGRGTAASSTTSRRRRARRRSAVTVILGPRPMSRREELTCQRLRNAVQLWTTVYTEMGWCDDMRDKLRLHMLLHATCSHREVEPRFIRVWLQGPVLQDAAAANRRRCVRNALTNVAEQEHEDGNHARMSVLYARAMLAYHYTLAAIGKHMHNLQDGEQSTDSDLDEAGEILVAAEDLLSQLESVKQMWYNAGFQGNFAEKSVRDAFADRTSSVLAQLAVTSLHTLQNHLRNTTAGARFSEIAGDMSARTSTTERQERDNKEAGRLRLLRLRRPTAARGFEGAYTLTV